VACPLLCMSIMRTTVTALVATTLVAVAPAAAQPLPPDTPTETTSSYASWTLGADGVSIALLLAGAAAEGDGGRDTDASNTLFMTGFFGSVFATPIIHGIRRHPDRALGSFALRAGLGSLGAYLGVATASCDHNTDTFCDLERIGPGFLVGIVIAGVIDAATMTTERHPAPTWAPVVSGDSHGVQLGLAGSF